MHVFQEIPIFRFALTDGLDDSFLPVKGSERATGWDVKCAKDTDIGPGEYVKIPLGFRVFAQAGWWLELRPRSSTFAKKSLHALYGVIDEDYEGQCLFACQFNPTDGFIGSASIKAGEAIGQIIPVIRQPMVVERVSNEEYDILCKERATKRGTGGFGSTG
jgi:dUTP pyrophosphatase